jgi:hypothetical protein
MTKLSIPLTPEQFEAKRAQAAAEGFTLHGDSGNLKAKGVDLEYAYDGAVLTITIEKVSFIDKRMGWGEERVAEKLKELLST